MHHLGRLLRFRRHDSRFPCRVIPVACSCRVDLLGSSDSRCSSRRSGSLDGVRQLLKTSIRWCVGGGLFFPAVPGGGGLRRGRLVLGALRRQWFDLSSSLFGVAFRTNDDEPLRFPETVRPRPVGVGT